MSAARQESCMLISKVQVNARSGSRGKERPPVTAETGGGCGEAPSTQFNNSTEDNRPATTRESTTKRPSLLWCLRSCAATTLPLTFTLLFTMTSC